MATMDLNVDFETVKMVHDSWDEVKKIPDVALVAGELLFRNIFRIAPGAWEMFPFGKGYDSAEDEMFQSPLFQAHAQKVVGMLDTAVHLLGPDLQILQEALVTLGAQHVGYGVFPDHYPIVGQALIETLSTALGDDFTPELQAAWAGVYGFVTDHMLKGAKEGLSRIIIHKVVLPEQDQQQAGAAIVRRRQRRRSSGSTGKSSTTKTKKEKKTITLENCLSAMLPQQQDLYYVTSDEIGPVLERLLKAGVIVLKMGPKQAHMVVTNLQKYLNRQMINVADMETNPNDFDMSFLPSPSNNKDDSSESSDRSPSPKSVTKFYNKTNPHGLDFNEAKDFCRWFQTTLGPQRVLACTPTCEFASLPARIIPYEGMDIQQSLHRSLSRSSDSHAPPTTSLSRSSSAQYPTKKSSKKKRHVEINPSHEFIVELQKIRSKHPDIAALMAHQIHDHCLLQENASPPRPSDMVNRMTDICMLLLKSKNQEAVETTVSC